MATATSWPKRRHPNDPTGKIKIGCKYRSLRRAGVQSGPGARLRVGSPCCPGHPCRPPGPPEAGLPPTPPPHPPRNRREKPSQSGKPRGCGNAILRSSQTEKGGGWEGHWPPLTSPKVTLRCWDTSPNPFRAGTPSPAKAVTQWDCADPGRPRLSTPSEAQTVELSGLHLPGAFVKGKHHIGSGRQGIHRSPDLL